MSVTNDTERRLCPEHEYRESLSEGDFWEHVLVSQNHWDDVTSNQDSPCSECGEYGACAYGAEGRPLYHAQPRDEEEEDPDAE